MLQFTVRLTLSVLPRREIVRRFPKSVWIAGDLAKQFEDTGKVRSHLVAALAQSPLATFELSCAEEVFGSHRAACDSDWYIFAVGSPSGGYVLTQAGLEVRLRYGPEIFERADTIIIPGWHPECRPTPDTLNMLRRAFSRGSRLAAIGTGTFLLAETGLLSGRHATTHWAHVDELKARFPEINVVDDVLYIDEGQLITGAGSTAAIDMFLHIVRRDLGHKAANRIAKELVTPPHRSGDQAQSVKRPVSRPKDDPLSKVLDYLRGNANRRHRTEDLAAMAAMSPTSFNRKFRAAVGRSPYDWLLHERVEIAKELLEGSFLPIGQVGLKAGFGSTQSFRANFQRIVGMNPANYRRTFSRLAGPDRTHDIPRAVA